MKYKNQLFFVAFLLVILTIVLIKKKTTIVHDQIITKQNPWVEKKHEIIPVIPTNPLPPIKPEKTEPQWIKYPAIRTPDLTLGKILADIDSHMPAGHIYSSNDKITWGHETTHGINSNLRNSWKAPNVNGFYCLLDRAVMIAEPKVTIQMVAPTVPPSLRGPVYDLYMIKQAASWGDRPLYIFDEWVAYTNGSEVRADLGISERSETVSQMLEFDVYALALAMAIKTQDKGYDDYQFKLFLKWNIERSFRLYKNEERAVSYLQNLRSNPDAEKMRIFTRDYLGKEWANKVIGF